MQERNELNDIILNKSTKSNGTKKVLLSIATFAIILILIVIIMNQFSGNKEASLPHAPKTSEVIVEDVVEEPEVMAKHDVPVIEKDIAHTSELIEEDDTNDNSVVPDGKDETERIYDAAFKEPEIIEEPVYETQATKTTPQKKQTIKREEPKQVLKPSKPKKLKKSQKVQPSGKYDPKKKRVVQTTSHNTASSGYYIQVGSFAKYSPSKSFLAKITRRGYTYTFHSVKRNGRTLNKVLVGPFRTQSAAREALPVIRRNVESGAFLTKI